MHTILSIPRSFHVRFGDKNARLQKVIHNNK